MRQAMDPQQSLEGQAAGDGYDCGYYDGEPCIGSPRNDDEFHALAVRRGFRAVRGHPDLWVWVRDGYLEGMRDGARDRAAARR